MADIKQLERALINADKAGDSDAARVLAGEIRKMRGAVAPESPMETSFADDLKQGTGNVAAGLVRGAGSIGSTIMAAMDARRALKSGNIPSLDADRERRKAMDEGLQSLGAETDSFGYGAGKLVGEVAGSAGAGGVLANGVRAAAPAATGFANALASGGFRAGTPGVAVAGYRRRHRCWFRICRPGQSRRCGLRRSHWWRVACGG
jgi:hypothetical protein